MFPKDTHVLVIDDMKGVRMFVRKLMNELGYTNVTEAAEGNEACAIVEAAAGRAPVGLIIADMNMPGMNGIEFLKWLRSPGRDNKVPLLFLTAEADKDKVLQALRLGANGYILKPANGASLQAKLEAIWNQLQKSAS